MRRRKAWMGWLAAGVLLLGGLGQAAQGPAAMAAAAKGGPPGGPAEPARAPAASAAAGPGASQSAPAARGFKRPWSEDVLYLIMTDRFANGDRTNDQDAEPGSITGVHGGDLEGVISKLDYLKELGITGIWLTPVVQNQKGGYHGYWATDFYKVDPRLGSMETLKRLVAEAHRREIKVLLDVVVNHTAPTHPWVNDPAKDDWFHHEGGIIDGNDQRQVERGQLAGLPDLAQENPEVAKYLIDMSKWWLEQTGVDGFRLDTVRHVPVAFWERYTREMKAVRPDVFLLGEVYHGDWRYMKAYLETGMDLLAFPRYYPVEGAFARGEDVNLLHEAVQRELRETTGTIWGSFIDNHDVPRFVTGSAPGGAAKLRLALTFLLTAPGMPVLYYGTESALEGGGDPDNRRDMKFGTNPEQFAFTKQLIKLRREHPAFTSGSYIPITRNPKIVSYIREYRGQRFLTVLNNSAAPQKLDLTGVLRPEDRLQPLLAGGSAVAPGARSLNMEPWSPQVYAVTQQAPVSIGSVLPLALVIGLSLLAVILVGRRAN